MLGNVIFLILFIVLLIELLKNIKKGIIIYVVFALISPNLNVGGFHISFEIISFFLVLLIYLLKKPLVFAIYRKYLFRQHLFIYFLIFILASLLATIRFGSALPWVSFLSIFRIICIIYMLQDSMKEKPDEVLDRIISPVLFINLVISIIQLKFPTSTSIFYDLYFKASMTPLESIVKLGHFDRAYGTFGTPVLLGIFSLFSFTVYFGFLIERKNCKRIYLKLMTSIVIGLLALSKTAVIGIPTIFLLSCILIIPGVIKVKNKKIAAFPLIIIPIIIITIQLLERQGTAISWYLAYLTKPFQALFTRYNTTNGILVNAYATISSNWLLGVGGTPLANDFIGDSMYTGIMYSTGIIGLFVYFSVLIGSTIKNLIYGNTTAFLLFICICLSGLGAPIQLDIVSVSLIAYIFSKSEIHKLVEHQKNKY